MKRIAGAMALGAVLVAGSMTAAEAAPKAYKVSAKVSKSTADVGNRIKISGKVSGESASKLKGDKVTIQRKYNGGGWQKVGTAKISSKRSFSLSTRLVKGGTTSFRVVKSKSGKIRSGVSSTRTIKVYKWIDLTTAPTLELSGGLRNHPVTVNGKTYPRNIQSSIGIVFLEFNPQNCTTFSTVVGFKDSEKSELEPTTEMFADVLRRATPSAEPTWIAGAEITPDQVKLLSVAIPLGGMIVVQAGGGGATTVLASPQARCNADTLLPIPTAFEQSPFPL